MSKRKTKHIIAAIMPDRTILAMNNFTNKFLWFRCNSKEIYHSLEAGGGVKIDGSGTSKSWLMATINSGTRLIR